MKARNIAYAVFVAAIAAIFVIGSGGPSEAKHKKKAEAPPQRSPICLPGGEAVCGMKGGMKFTYANSCYAQQDGAKITAMKACPEKKAMKPHKSGMKAKKKKA